MSKKGMRLKSVAIVAMALLSAVWIVGKAFAEDLESPKVFYKDGFRIESPEGNYTFLINGRLQSRFTFTHLDGAKSTDSFAIQRGEIRMEGHVFTKKLTYGFEMGFATRVGPKTVPVCTEATCDPTKMANAITTDTTTGLAVLNDFYLDWQPKDQIGVKFGQFKVPFLYTELVSAMKQEFPDRNLVHDNFTLGRDIGFDIHGNVFNYHLGYHVYVMNGDGQNNLHSKRAPMFGTRLEIPIMGDYKYSESDVEYTEDPALGVGLAYLLDDRGSAFENSTIPANVRTSHGTFDVHFRSHGFFALGQGMLSRVHQGAKKTNWGYSAQAGYFVIPKHLEVALRAGGAVFSDATPNQYEYGACLGYYFFKHNLKLQTDYALLRNQRGLRLNDHRFRTQVTLVF